MSQIWIKSRETYILARFCKARTFTKWGVLLLPGLFEPSCDLYYFNQEFLEELKNTEYCGFTFDYAGQGDSYSDILKSSIPLFQGNIVDSIDFLKKQGILNMVAVGRGISGNLLQSISDLPEIKSIYRINPLILDQRLLDVMDQVIRKHKTTDIKLTKEVLVELQNILYMSGVDMSNIEDETVSIQFLREFIDNYYNLFSEANLQEGKSRTIITADVEKKYTRKIDQYLWNVDFSSYNARLRIIHKILNDLKN